MFSWTESELNRTCNDGYVSEFLHLRAFDQLPSAIFSYNLNAQPSLVKDSLRGAEHSWAEPSRAEDLSEYNGLF